jgi:DNA-binding protein Fis
MTVEITHHLQRKAIVTMKKILILFAHPALEKSRVHKVLLNYISDLDGITLNDLYENYPEDWKSGRITLLTSRLY